MQKREYTQDVFFYQLSIKQVFFWQGNTYVKVYANRAERRTNDAGEQLKGPGPHIAFEENEVVIISNDDVDNLRFRNP